MADDLSEIRNRLRIMPCIDSDQMAADRQRELNIRGDVAMTLAWSQIEAAREGFYVTRAGQQVVWRDAVEAAYKGKVSIPPDAALPGKEHATFDETLVQITNETTVGAARRLVERGLRPLALNFANGVEPGGGFLRGARAQEETLCRCSALYQTLIDDPMYEEHRKRHLYDSTDWSIYSPHVPVFRTDNGTELESLWLLSFITCAAPYAPATGQELAGRLLKRRIHRVLAIARAYGHSALVLGAWGCGAFGNDPLRTALDFRRALEHEYSGSFSEVVFAIADWSPKRMFLGPFRDVFRD